MSLEYSKIDPCSFSNPDKVAGTHIDIKWTVDFEAKLVKGIVTHTMYVENVEPSSWESVNFDSNNLTIYSVDVNGESNKFSVGEPKGNFGSCVSVPISEKLRAVGTKLEIAINYSCSPEASAIQWLEPSATKGGKFPYVFTQCQAIHARSLLPCMDSPGVKSTYTAEVHCPEWCTVLMSALAVDDKLPKGVFKFEQPLKVPCYLIALAAGDLQSRDISPRVRVWSEPEVVDKAAYEFAETEQFLQAAESLTCPYPWGRYDILCLPPSFPYGGMENPCLTFATPTLLAGDRSLADVIAHEIAHSWTGNLVTNHTWEHFWLNEGWTVWLERKIMSVAKKDEEYAKLSAEIGWAGFSDAVSGLGHSHDFTHLVNPLGEGDPDDAFGRVPYEKGFNTLNYLEGIVGTPKFMEFAKAYLDKFKFDTVSSGDFRDCFLSFFEDNQDVKDVDWNTLFHTPGMFFKVPDFSNSLSRNAKALADEWIAYSEKKSTRPEKVSKKDFDSWVAQQKVIFLQTLQTYADSSKDSIPLHVLEELDGIYSLTGYANAEVKFLWQKLCLDSEAPWIVNHVVDFVTTQGRMKFVRPLYKALRYSKVGAYAAIVTFAKYANVYHPICKKMVSKDFAVADERSPLPKGWMVIEGKVYDVEAYLNFHPGGDAALVDHFGLDATDSFLDVGHSGGARRLLKSYYVMNVDGTKDPKEEPKKTVAPSPAAVSESATVSSSSSSSTAASTTTTAPASTPTDNAAPTATSAPSNVDIPASKPVESSTNWLPIIGGATLVAIAVFAVLRSRK